jgi:ribose-phosphate pyrophosphokinase
MNLYLIDDALRRSSVEKITYVLPHIPYQRKDRMDKPRVPISARRTVQMVIDTNYSIPTRIVTFDMHAGQIQGFVSFPLDHLNASPIFVDYLRQLSDPDTFVIVSPDTGGVTRARHMAKKLNNNEIVLVDKRRPAPGEAEVMHIVGEEIVKDRPCVIRDDIADTGGTACKAANALREAGATYIYLCATHGVFSRQKNNGRTAEEEFRKSGIKVITTDTIPRSEDYIEANKDWLTVLSVVPMTAEAIYRIQTRGSLSELIE